MDLEFNFIEYFYFILCSFVDWYFEIKFIVVNKNWKKIIKDGDFWFFLFYMINICVIYVLVLLFKVIERVLKLVLSFIVIYCK